MTCGGGFHLGAMCPYARIQVDKKEEQPDQVRFLRAARLEKIKAVLEELPPFLPDP